jgi:triosephosphate isomerase
MEIPGMTSRRPLIAGNWKMHKTSQEAVETARALASYLGSAPREAEVMIAPPFTALTAVWEAIRGSGIALAAQNLHWEKEGAYTGEISGAMLLACGCTHVIIGHSERRHLFGETDEAINRKLKAAVACGLIPVLCVGETESEREQKKTFSVLDKQIGMGLEGLSSAAIAPLVVAYEPVWAIGTGKTATADQAQEVQRFLRERMGEKVGIDIANSIRILYGGSVTPDNIAGLMAMPDVDGALVGGASLKAESFKALALYNS